MKNIKLFIVKNYFKIVLSTVLLSFFLFMSFNIVQISPKNDIEEMNLKGNVKSLKQTAYDVVIKKGEIHKGKINEGYESNQYFLFDTEGNKIEESSYKYQSDGSINKYTYKYDNIGNKVEKIFYTPNGSLNQKYIYRYDEKRNLVEKSDYFSDGNLGNKYTYKYNVNGKLIEYKDYLGTRLDETHTYKYDENENEIEWSMYNSDGDLIIKWVKKYDENGNKIEEYKYDSNDNLEEKIVFKYDNKGNKIEEIGYDSLGTILVKNNYKYNDKGYLINFSSNTLLYGGLKQEVKYKYDVKGNIIEEYKYNSFGKAKENSTFMYEFDKHNNWIKRIIYLKKRPISITERTIVYY